MMRIGLFFLTNLAVLAVASVTMSILGVGNYLDASGGINLQQLLIFSAIFGMAGSLVSLFLSKWMAKKSAKVQIIEQPQNTQQQWLLQTVAELSERAGIGMPEVGIFPAQQSNAFATGWNRNNALVAVSAGLLQRFDPQEARAVLAHEIGHVANGDMITLTLLQGVINTFVIFFSRIIGHIVDKAVFKTERGYGPGFYITSFIAQIVLGILASTIVMAFSRWREYRADAAGAQLADPRSMIRALQRLKAETEIPNQLPGTLTAFGITEGVKQGLAGLFTSHPPLDARIKALESGQY